ncbi:hypothetical protein H2198_005975 [Neophaeococcomyces mojaviensis]|uniref:Uncharacterized protein n=1 Tax=Neophaeococcomyces mojaviensis TaxID=3383035 RepID=A0ACC3A4Q1_9EURO|nr:hypothetical protein H2198_005975 [Knufia sp. JES_112]
MPRMTRAALRAQQAEDEHEPQQESLTPARKEQRPAPAEIHEDSVETEAEREPETQETKTAASNNSSVRPALRDITDENYPVADLDQSDVKAPQEQQQPPLENTQDEVLEARKSTKKGRGKAKGRTKKKVEAVTVIDSEVDEAEEQKEPRITEPGVLETNSNEPVEESVQCEEVIERVSQPGTAEDPLVLTQEHSTPGPALEEEVAPQLSAESFTAKTPKFDPAIHSSDYEASATTEDSFVHSITSRSPSKPSQSQTEYSQPSQLFSSSLQAHPTLRRTSSTNFEESFEAMDSLEDTIEQMTAGLPILSAEEMDSPESPAKVDRRSLRAQPTSTTPNISAARSPSSSTKLQSMLKARDKENTPLKARTPLSKHTTPLKTKTPLARETTPFKSRTPAANEPSPAKTVRASARKTASKVTTNTESDTTATMPKKQETAEHQPNVSLPNSPAKQQPNTQKKRSTSGVLSTAKPGFIPSKSTKPPTTSTFALPGDAIAEKLKAQREAREEKMKQPKMSLAEQKSAKLKADREAREERVRQNQEKAREVSNSDKPKPVVKHNRPLSVHMQPSIAPRENKASQARMSRVFSGSDKENVAPQPATAAAPSTSRGSLAVTKTRMDSSTTTTKPNTAANRKSVVIQSSTRGLEARPSKPRPASAVITSAQHAKIASISNGQKSTVTKEDAVHQKVRGKEVFMRSRQNLEQEQKEKREKEEAARKARAEAAAAGRQASREWAERMMKRKQGQVQIHQAEVQDSAAVGAAAVEAA